MSVSSEIARIQTNIANAYTACESKGATLPQTQNSANLAETISDIPSGSQTVQSPTLILIDWEGTKLAEYSAEDALALSALPAPSTLPSYAVVDHSLLIFQEWNWSLADIKTWIQAHEGETLGVVAIYITADGQDHDFWNNPRLDSANNICAQKRGTASINDNSFFEHNALCSINIPNGTAVIGSAAFQKCFSLASIGIPNGVTSINTNAFRDCPSLVEIGIPNSVTNLSDAAFYNCASIKHISLPDNIRYLGKQVCQSCKALITINIPAKTQRILDYSFTDCYSLVNIKIPSNVLGIANNAFLNCYCLSDILLESKPGLSNTNAFTNLPSNYRLYVPRADLSWFETATNWSAIYGQGHIVAIEDYIEYLESIGFNVDEYKEET